MDTTNMRQQTDFKKYNKIFFVFFSAIIVYIIAALFNDVFVNAMSSSGYLTWHIIFESASILVSFSIFTVTYFVYEESKSLNMVIFGCTFLLMALLDMFHMLSYKGMADFFIANLTSNRATTLWILSRLFGSIGFMLATFIPKDLVSKVKKEPFIIVTAIFSLALFIIVTFYPNFFPIMFIEGKGLTDIKIYLEYLVILIFSITFMRVNLIYRKTNSNREYRFMMALILMIFSEFAFTNYGNVYDAFNYVGHFFKVIAFMILYRAIYIENLTAPYRELKRTKDELKVYSNHLDLLVEQRTKELENLNEILLTDIEYAKEVQGYLLPEQLPQNMPVSFDAKFFIAERLSGDFYNVIKLDKDNVALYTGDVSGHGVSAAMLTVFANQNVIQLKEGDKGSGEIIEPGCVLKTLYKSFNKTNISSEKYILMFYGIYNINTKRLTYSSAGINTPPYIIKSSGEIVEIVVKGLPICKLGDLVDPYYEDMYVDLDPGDKVLFYSDGLLEARNKAGKEYGEDRLEKLLRKNYQLNSTDLNNKIKEDLFNYIGINKHLEDDTTLLIMEIA